MMSDLLGLTAEQGKQLLMAAGIEIPYPQQTVWHRVERAQIENLHRAGRAMQAVETPDDGQA